MFKELRWHIKEYAPFYFIGILATMIFGVIIYLATDEVMHPEHYRATIEYNGQIKKCKVELPRVSEGKSSYYTGVVNLTNCEDGQDILAASNVKVIEQPKCGCL
jgi:hypothetical protein